MSCLRLPIPKRLFSFKKAGKKFILAVRRRVRSFHRRRHTTATSNPRLVYHRRYPSSVYVDRLFQADPPTALRPQEALKMAAPMVSSSTIDGGRWKENVESIPQIQGIDEKAEEFISKFRQQMKIERELSLLDYHEMLARST